MLYLNILLKIIQSIKFFGIKFSGKFIFATINKEYRQTFKNMLRALIRGAGTDKKGIVTKTTLENIFTTSIEFKTFAFKEYHSFLITLHNLLNMI